MEISLTPKLEEYIQQQVRTGLYENPSEVVRTALINTISLGSPDVNALVQYVLREAYLQQSNDLKDYASKVKWFNQGQNRVGYDAQLANMDLQNALQKQQQTLQMISNISKMLHDTENTVMRNIGDSSSMTENEGNIAFSPSKGLVKFMQRYISDPNFRIEMEKNPSMTLNNSGLDVSKGEIALLSKIPIDELHKSLSNIPNITRSDTASAAVVSLDLLSNEEYQPSPGVRKFVELYISNPNFRNSFKSNPSRAVNTFNVKVKCDEVKQLAQIPVEKLEKEFSNIPNVTRQNIVMAISDGIRSKTAVEGWPSEDMQLYIKKYVSDPSFRDAFSRNPESALKDAGFQISGEEATYLSNQNLEELEKSVPSTTRMDLPVTYDALGTLNDSLNDSNKEKETADKMAAMLEAYANLSSGSQGPQSESATSIGTGGAAIPGLLAASAQGGGASLASDSAAVLGLIPKADTGTSPIKTIYFGNPDKTWLLVVTNMVPNGGS